MTFTFLHTADWQIGKPFGGLDADRASILKHARLTAIDRLADAAVAGGARHVVVCGDVFDAPGLADRVLRETLARLVAHQELTWHLLPGNHDPARADGIWQRISAIGVPGNVRLLLSAAPQHLAPDVVILPAPLMSKAVSHDPTLWMVDAVTAPGVIRIGVAHGSTQGFGSNATASVGIDPGRRASAGLDYLALGDWHGVREVAAGTWYSGTPEPDQFPDNDPGFALLVTIDGAGAEPRVTKVATAMHTWLKRAVTVAGVADLDPLAAELTAFGPGKASLLLELTLRGTVSLEADAAIAVRLQELEPSLFHLRVRRDELMLAARDDEITGLRDPQIARVAEQLIELRKGAQDPAIAEGALRRLYAICRQATGQQT